MAPSEYRCLALTALVAVTVAVAAVVPGLAAANSAAAAAAVAPNTCVSPPPRVVRLNPDGLFHAGAFGFTQLSVDTEAGVVYLSGQAAQLDDASLAPGDLRAQAKVVRENILTGLAAVGSAPADILRITSFIVRLLGICADSFFVSRGKAVHVAPYRFRLIAGCSVLTLAMKL